jgi:hypothetical protein
VDRAWRHAAGRRHRHIALIALHLLEFAKADPRVPRTICTRSALSPEATAGFFLPWMDARGRFVRMRVPPAPEGRCFIRSA